MSTKLLTILLLAFSIMGLQACGEDSQLPVGSYIEISPETVEYTGTGISYDAFSVTVKNANGVPLGDAEVSMSVSNGMVLYHDVNENGFIDANENPVDFSATPTFTTDEFSGTVHFVVAVNVTADYKGAVSAFSGDAYGVANFSQTAP